MKPTFLQYEKPLLCAMILCATPEACIEKIRASHMEGADAFGIQLCRLRREYRTPEILKEIFAECQGKPIYVTSYRYCESEGMTDDECADLLLLAADCGATLCDVFGDMYDLEEYYQLTEQPEAVQKQMALIDELHRRGAEVLISSHVLKSISKDEVVHVAMEQVARGTDVIKIVVGSERIEELSTYIDAIHEIRKKTDKKLLLLSSGPCQIIRYFGPALGVCMYLCLQNKGPQDAAAQPLIREAKALRDMYYPPLG